jgi:hypothetical protein
VQSFAIFGKFFDKYRFGSSNLSANKASHVRQTVYLGMRYSVIMNGSPEPLKERVHYRRILHTLYVYAPTRCKQNEVCSEKSRLALQGKIEIRYEWCCQFCLAYQNAGRGRIASHTNLVLLGEQAEVKLASYRTPLPHSLDFCLASFVLAMIVRVH